jgi:hypothetical protein
MLNINSKLIASTNPVMKKYIGLSGELTFNDEGLAFFMHKLNLIIHLGRLWFKDMRTMAKL